MDHSMTIQDLIIGEANRQGVPAAIALAVASRESGLQHTVAGGAVKRGAAGEIGIFQLMPGTAAALGVNAFDLAQNVQGGVRYLRQMFEQFGTWTLAVEAYNCGPGCIEDVIDGRRKLPASTAAYAAAVLPGAAAANVITASPPPAPIVRAPVMVVPGGPGNNYVTVADPALDTPAQDAAPLSAYALLAGVAVLGAAWFLSD
jgi:soluble lytic murein transglycosylase-like protein